MPAADEVLTAITAEVVRDAAGDLVTKLAGAGYVLVPVTADEKMLAAALLLGSAEPSQEDRELAARAFALLPGNLPGPEHQDLVNAAAYLAQNYRAMVSVLRSST
jgi:hypothetical protein